jgi:hypothetical protein
MHERILTALREPFEDVRERIRASNRAYFTYLTDDPRLARINALEAIGVSASSSLASCPCHSGLVEEPSSSRRAEA